MNDCCFDAHVLSFVFTLLSVTIRSASTIPLLLLAVRLSRPLLLLPLLHFMHLITVMQLYHQAIQQHRHTSIRTRIWARTGTNYKHRLERVDQSLQLIRFTRDTRNSSRITRTSQSRCQILISDHAVARLARVSQSRCGPTTRNINDDETAQLATLTHRDRSKPRS